MSPVTIQILGDVDGSATPFDDQYVAGPFLPIWGGFGELPTTRDRAEAMRFDSAIEAFSWLRERYPNGRGGYRVDGKPNRPLTRFTASIAPIEEPIP